MSVTTQLQIRSLARDPSGQLASQAGALRRAENVVIRAPGVAESRPNFGLLYENTSTTRRVKALAYFANSMIAFERDTAGLQPWTARNLTTNLNIVCEANPSGGFSAYEPPDYNASETRFAEARRNLYSTGKYGGAVIEDPVTTGRMAGVDMGTLTDFPLATRNWSTVSTPEATGTYAYRFVFVRKDSNGYIRRSPPSARYAQTLTMVGNSGTFGTGTRFYFPSQTDSNRLAPGDKVEFYRTRVAEGLTPPTEHFLALSYVLTTTDLANGYFVPPADTVADADLGAALYTNTGQGGAIAAKYAPPVARALAWWDRVMWFGATTDKARATVELRNLHRAGLMKFAQIVTFTLGSPIVTLPDTTGMKAGMFYTDNYQYGPTVVGAFVPANTYIQSVNSATQITLNANALAGGAPVAGVMSPVATQGLISEGTGNGSYTLGSPIVTGFASTAGWRAGMYITDSTTIGPTADGTTIKAGTKILSIDSGTQITMTQNALATNVKGARVGDIVVVYGVEFYAWDNYGVGGPQNPYTQPATWTSAFVRCFAILDARFGEFALQVAVTNLVKLINYHRVIQTPGPVNYLVQAIPSGDLVPAQVGIAGGAITNVNWSYELGLMTLSTFARGFTIEERGVGYVAFSINSTLPTAFNPPLGPMDGTGTQGIPDQRLNRLFWSDLDEPEAVRVTSYVDVGSQAFPIMALAALPHALLVFKQDGVYRVTGSGPSSWSVECIDATMRLVRAECVTVVNGEAYCWCERGFFAVNETGSRSLSAGALDVELRHATQYVFGDVDTHGAFVCALRSRNIVLFGIPLASEAVVTGRIYCLSLVTGAFSEWPLAWGPVAESRQDELFYSRAVDAVAPYEVRISALNILGYDRAYSLSSIVSLVGTTLVLTSAITGAWIPTGASTGGDMVSALIGGVRYFRRITAAALGANWTLTLESEFPAGAASSWTGYEMAQAKVVLEWHPTSPAGIPVGALCREIQVQLDLRSAPSAGDKLVSIPEYAVGGTTERDVSATLVASARPRVAQIQPLRVGCSRQIARSANIAPFFSTADIFAMRVNGISLVWEGTSERTRR